MRCAAFFLSLNLPGSSLPRSATLCCLFNTKVRMSAPAGGGSSLNRYQAIPVHDDPPLYPPPPASASASAKHQSKGKGKGKAIPDDEEQGLSFGIRFTDGQTPDLVNLWVGHRETVRDLKRRVRAAAASRGQESSFFSRSSP